MTHNKSALNQYEMFVHSTLVPEVFLDFSPHEMEKSRKPLGPGYVRSFVYLENCLEKFVLISTIEMKKIHQLSIVDSIGRNTGVHITGGVNFTMLPLF